MIHIEFTTSDRSNDTDKIQSGRTGRGVGVGDENYSADSGRNVGYVEIKYPHISSSLPYFYTAPAAETATMVLGIPLGVATVSTPIRTSPAVPIALAVMGSTSRVQALGVETVST